MSTDLSEFHDVFFEECFERLGVMESGLLTLDKGTDVEEINSIFRAAHSIKGGSASFGFMDISSFTHVMETLLDEMRDGRRQVEHAIVDLLLESVDVLNGMVTAAKEGGESDAARTAEVQQKLEAVLEKSGDDDTSTQSCSDESGSSSDTGPTSIKGQSQVWRIKFKPDADMMKNGNDPARIFRELQKLADMTITVDTTALPAYADLEPESSYLSWALELHGDVEEKDIRELFSWVEDDSELVITPPDAETSAEENHGTAKAEDETAIAEAAVAQQSEAAPLPDAGTQPQQENRSAATAQAAETPKTAGSKEGI